MTTRSVLTVRLFRELTFRETVATEQFWFTSELGHVIVCPLPPPDDGTLTIAVSYAATLYVPFCVIVFVPDAEPPVGIETILDGNSTGLTA